MATTHRHSIGTAIGDALVILAVTTIVALAYNALRDEGVELITHEAPAVLVPCPEPTGEITAVTAADVAWGDVHDLVIDARSAADYGAWHAPDARHLVYDFLDPVPDDVVGDLVTAGSRRIVVYGDGGRPDTGEQLAGELAGRGLRNVAFVTGGVTAVREALEGGEP